ncbi:MAG: hypothetical protein PVH88_23500 [Ignavibacteria bacterium]|jgi:hypothetical protein
MSIIFGIFYRDGKPVTNELEQMFSGMNDFPHEKHNYIKKDNSGFGHLLTYNTPEAVNETMPKWVEDANLLFLLQKGA